MTRVLQIAAACTLSLLILAAAGTAHADPLMSNLGSSHDGDFAGTPDSADDFMTGGVGLLIDSIDVFWDRGNGGTSNRVGIFTDLGGLPSLTQVGGWFTNGTAITDNTLINYSGSAVLAANTSYWMVVDTLDGSQMGFTFNQVVFSAPETLGATINGPNPGSAFGDAQAGTWTADPANLLYRLNGDVDAVPEPGTFAMFGLALAGYAVYRRRRTS